MNSFQARDKCELHYKYYPSESSKVMILLHGISEDHDYLSPLAHYISTNNLAHVYTPDLRGYGINAQRRGDIDYIGQHEDDLVDFIKHINSQHEQPSIILAGHSAGGGSVLRYAVSSYSNQVNGYLLLSPFVHPVAPTTPKKNEKSHSSAKLTKLIMLMILNRFNIKRYNHWKVYFNNKPKELRHGRETLELSYRLLFSRFPSEYRESLKALRKPTLVLVGDGDEEFIAAEYSPLFGKYTDANVHIIKGATHDGVLSSPETFQHTKRWLEEIS